MEKIKLLEKASEVAEIGGAARFNATLNMFHGNLQVPPQCHVETPSNSHVSTLPVRQAILQPVSCPDNRGSVVPTIFRGELFVLGRADGCS